MRYKIVHWKKLLLILTSVIGSVLIPIYGGIGLWELLNLLPPSGEIPTVMAYWLIGAWTIAGLASAIVILSFGCWGVVRLGKYIYN